MNRLKNAAHRLLDFIFPRSKDDLFIDTVTDQKILEKITVRQPFEDIHSLVFFNYNDELIRKLIWALKYRGRKEVAMLFARALYANLLEHLSDMETFSNFKTPLLIPIPLSKKRLRERGFNQSALLAEALSALDTSKTLSVQPNVLIRVLDTEHQARLQNRKKREKNIKQAFAIHNKESVINQNIILIDDVITTGSTVREARRVLLEAGARDVFVVAIAH